MLCLTYRAIVVAGFCLITLNARGASLLETRLQNLEARRAERLTPHQRAMAERIMMAARDYEGGRQDGTFTLWIKASLGDNDRVLIDSIADLLWDTKARLHLPLATSLDHPAVIHRPRNAGSVLILENPTNDADVYRDHQRLDRILDTIVEEGNFAVVLFVDDKNILERMSKLLTEKLKVVDLTVDATPCENTMVGPVATEA